MYSFILLATAYSLRLHEPFTIDVTSAEEVHTLVFSKTARAQITSTDESRINPLKPGFCHEKERVFRG
jgi:hypothetical protein